MSTLDEITNEKQRITGHSRVLMRSAKSLVDSSRTGGDRACAGALRQRHADEKDGLGQNSDRGNQVGRPSATRRALAHCDRKTAGGKRSSPNLSDQVLALATGKTQPEITAHARALARTMSAPRLPGTNGLAASKSAMGSSTPLSRQEQNKGLRSEPT